MKKIEKELENIIKVKKHAIPYWNELPEIDLYMDQVITLMNRYFKDFKTSEQDVIITHSMINNYVKNGIMPSPIKKKYSREHLAYLLIIGILKSVLSLPEISRLIKEKLEKDTLEEVLNYFSDTYDAITEVAIKSFATYLKESSTEFDIATYTAIASSLTKLISDKILVYKIKEDELRKEKLKKIEKEKKDKEKKNNK